MDPVIRHVDARSAITKTDLPVCDYAVNPYVGCTHGCRYCYACFMKRFTDHPEPWGTFLDVKHWPSIRDPSRYAGKELFIGSVTDPYLPEEAEFGRTRELLEQLRGSGAKLSIATKSDLVLRDLDLIRGFPDARVSWSINTLDEGFKEDMDRAVPIGRRLAAMKAFHDAGVRTTYFISPIFPGITDVEAIIERAKDICNLVWLENLNLRGQFKSDIFGYIRERHPDLVPLYDAIYSKGDRSYWRDLDVRMREYASRAGLDYVVNDDSLSRPFDSPPVVVNYFFHEQIRKSSNRRGPRMITAEELRDRLLDAYGEQGWWSDDPYTVIIQSVLVQNTAWGSVERVSNSIDMSPEAVRSMTASELEDVIRPCGCARSKARTIGSLTQWFLDRRDSVDAVPTDLLRDELLGIWGVGEETADVILVYAFRRPSFIIDSYTRRLVGRLIPGPWDDMAIREFFSALPQDAETYGMMHRLILEHCIGFCRKEPRCGRCPLCGHCPSSQMQAS